MAYIHLMLKNEYRDMDNQEIIEFLNDLGAGTYYLATDFATDVPFTGNNTYSSNDKKTDIVRARTTQSGGAYKKEDDLKKQTVKKQIVELMWFDDTPIPEKVFRGRFTRSGVTSPRIVTLQTSPAMDIENIATQLNPTSKDTEKEDWQNNRHFFFTTLPKHSMAIMQSVIGVTIQEKNGHSFKETGKIEWSPKKPQTQSPTHPAPTGDPEEEAIKNAYRKATAAILKEIREYMDHVDNTIDAVQSKKKIKNIDPLMQKKAAYYQLNRQVYPFLGESQTSSSQNPKAQFETLKKGFEDFEQNYLRTDSDLEPQKEARRKMWAKLSLGLYVLIRSYRLGSMFSLYNLSHFYKSRKEILKEKVHDIENKIEHVQPPVKSPQKGKQ